MFTVEELVLWNINSKTGRKKGSIPWNKGKKCPQLSGSNNSFWGRTHSRETKDKIAKAVFATKRVNGTLNASLEEITIKEKLLQLFPKTKHQYKSDVYPFICDFYIPDIDTYIEYNGFWTHGHYSRVKYGAYDSTNESHQKLLQLWEHKSITSRFYKQAIYVWTKLDIKKRHLAQSNNLKFLEFWDMQEFDEWYENYSNQSD